MYSDPRRETERYSLPDMEIFQDSIVLVSCKRCHRDDDETEEEGDSDA